MSLLDEMYEDGQSDKQILLENIHKEELENVQKFLKDYSARKYNIVNVGFGNQLIKDVDGKYHDLNKEYSIRDMKRKKGLNFGSHEFSYKHDAIILEDINIRLISKTNTLLVAPISSTKRRNSVLLEKKHNPFLERDSYILLGSIANIGIEKIFINDSKRRLSRQGSKILYELNNIDQNKVKEALKKLFVL
jgi:hypothetical protein